jgi:hypothetical protein
VHFWLGFGLYSLSPPYPIHQRVQITSFYYFANSIRSCVNMHHAVLLHNGGSCNLQRLHHTTAVVALSIQLSNRSEPSFTTVFREMAHSKDFTLYTVWAKKLDAILCLHRNKGFEVEPFSQKLLWKTPYFNMMI